MKRGTAMIWPILCGACLFYLGYLTHSFIAPDNGQPPPTYLENLIKRVQLSDHQQTQIRALLDEEDRRIDELLKGDESKKLWRNIEEIRNEISTKVEELLDDDQKRLYDQDSKPGPK